MDSHRRLQEKDRRINTLKEQIRDLKKEIKEKDERIEDLEDIDYYQDWKINYLRRWIKWVK